MSHLRKSSHNINSVDPMKTKKIKEMKHIASCWRMVWWCIHANVPKDLSKCLLSTPCLFNCFLLCLFIIRKKGEWLFHWNIPYITKYHAYPCLFTHCETLPPQVAPVVMVGKKSRHVKASQQGGHIGKGILYCKYSWMVTADWIQLSGR